MNMISLFNDNYKILNMIKLFSNNMRISTEKLSSGEKISRAADSPSSMLRISKMESRLKGSQVAQRNIQDGISLLQTADSSVSSLAISTTRLRELAVQYTSELLSFDDKKSIQDEARGLLKEMVFELKNATFNGINIFDKSSFYIQTGFEASESCTIKIDTLNSLKSIISSSQYAGNLPENKYPTGVSLTHSDPGYSGWDKLYDKDLNLIFQGDFSNGLPEGYGTVFNPDGTIYYTGDFKQGKFNGYGTLNDDSGNLIYTGDFSNGLFNGYGVLYNNNKILYNGDFFYGKYIDTEKSFINLQNLDIADVLNTDFIDKNISNPINNVRTSLGIMENSLEIRITSQQDKEVSASDELSKITDIDMASELMNKTRNEMLLNINMSLFSNNLTDNKNYILQLLR